MSMLPSDCAAVTRRQDPPPPRGLAKVLRVVSVLTMLMTVPQVLAIWVDKTAGGVSVASWGAYLVAACLWLVYGLRKKDPTIYLACIGWIALDAAVVIGAVIYRA